jgi:hypothetical protein
MRTIGTRKSGGRLRRIRVLAVRPPAEAQSTTTSNAPVGATANGSSAPEARLISIELGSRIGFFEEAQAKALHE